MPKTVIPITLTRIPSAVPHIALYNASSATTKGQTYRIWMNLRTGAVTCYCPAYSTHCKRKARERGVVQNMSKRFTVCKHILCALDDLDERGEVRAVLDTGFSKLRVEVDASWNL